MSGFKTGGGDVMLAIRDQRSEIIPDWIFELGLEGQVVLHSRVEGSVLNTVSVGHETVHR